MIINATTKDNLKMEKKYSNEDFKVMKLDASLLNVDPRASWPDHKREALAPTVVKRRGYHRSVYSSDATPFVRVVCF